MTYSNAYVRRLTVDERNDLATVLATLDEDAWLRRTPCDGWTVRDLVAHIYGWDALLVHATAAGHARALKRWFVANATARFRPDRLNTRLVQSAPWPGPELLDRFNRQLPPQPCWLFDSVARGAQLAEFLIHHHDVRVAVDQPRVAPPERVRVALDGITRVPGLHAKALLAKNTWTALDLDWRAGRGPAVEGTGEEILLALAGRHTGLRAA